MDPGRMSLDRKEVPIMRRRKSPRPPGKKGILIVAVLLVYTITAFLPGCGKEEGDVPDRSAKMDEETAPETVMEEEKDKEPIYREKAGFVYGETTGGTEEVMVLEDIRFGHGDYERLVIQFTSPAYEPHYGIPRYRLRYLTPPYSDLEGNPVPLDGDYLLEITFSGNKADLSPPEGYVQVYAGPEDFSPGFGVIKQARLVPAYELNTMILVVGLGRHSPYKVLELSNPPRLVVDVAK